MEELSTTIHVKNKFVELLLYDTAGQEEWDFLRPLVYPDTHVVLVTFSLVNIQSFYNVKERVGILLYNPDLMVLVAARNPPLSTECSIHTRRNKNG